MMSNQAEILKLHDLFLETLARFTADANPPDDLTLIILKVRPSPPLAV